MSTLAFSAGMAAPLVYLSFSFYDRYGFSKKLCNAFCAASCIAAIDETLTHAEIAAAMRLAAAGHDESIGYNWDYLASIVDEVVARR